MRLKSFLTLPFKLTLSAFLVILAVKAHSACSLPVGSTGSLQWIPSDSKVKFCDGATWRDTTVSTGASCTGITAGKINSNSSDIQFCNGSNWISMKGNPISDCSGTKAGTMNFNSGEYRFCDGSNWFKMRASNSTIAVDSTSVARVSGFPANNADLSSATFTPPNNSMVVVAINAFTWNNSISDIDVSVSDSAGNTYFNAGEMDPQTAYASGYEGHASLFYGLITTGSSMSVIVRRTGNSTGGADFLTFKVYIITGHDPLFPIGDRNYGQETTNNTSPIVLTSTYNGSRSILSASDSNKLDLPTSTDDEDAFHSAGGNLSGMSIIKASNTVTAGTDVTFNLDAFGTGNPKMNWVAAEILPEQTWANTGKFSILGPLRVRGSPADNVDVLTTGFTPPNNALVLVMLNSDSSSAASANYSVSSSDGATWTMAAKADVSTVGNGGHASLWWAKIPTGGTHTFVKVRRTSSNGTTNATLFAHVWLVTGHDTTTPIGNTGFNTSTTNNLTVTAFNSSVNGSLGFACATDWNALGLPTSTDISSANHNPSGFSSLSVRKTSATAISGTPVTFNFDAATAAAASWNWVAVEIRPAP